MGVYGGAFDPPHQAHRVLAQTALQQLALDVLHVVPTGRAWHKERDLLAFAHRFTMARLAFEGLGQVVMDEREGSRPGASYTIDTLTELQVQYPQARLFLIIGEDQARSFRSWHRSPEIMKFATICVAPRASSVSVCGPLDSTSWWMDGWIRLQTPSMELSATELRAQLVRGVPVVPLVCEPVARYIADHHLYQ